MNDSPIGIFDSGVGGLTVLKELHKILPYEQLIYLGDTARLPYGPKSPETVIRYSLENCAFLMSQKVKCIVVACHTASSLALEAMQKSFSLPILGVVDPAIAITLATSSHGRIGILGTQGTINSGTYQEKILRALPTAKITTSIAPLLVTLVEEGFTDHLISQLAVDNYLEPLIQADVDTIVLACTHFPLLEPLMRPSSRKLIDPALPCAFAVQKALQDQGLLSSCSHEQEPIFYVTDNPDQFQQLAPRFLKQRVTNVHLKQIF